MHQLFIMIGPGERAGAGIAKIQQGWPTGGGSFSIDELFEPSEQTITEPLFNDLSVEMSGKIIELIKNNQMITISELAVILVLSERTIERYMKQLQQEGIIHRVGPKKGGLWEIIE